MRTRESKHIPVSEPVDFHALETAYRKARWRWGTKETSRFPSALELKNKFESIFKGNGWITQSGGIEHSSRGFALDPKIAQHYKPLNGSEIVIPITEV